MCYQHHKKWQLKTLPPKFDVTALDLMFIHYLIVFPIQYPMQIIDIWHLWFFCWLRIFQMAICWPDLLGGWWAFAWLLWRWSPATALLWMVQIPMDPKKKAAVRRFPGVAASSSCRAIWRVTMKAWWLTPMEALFRVLEIDIILDLFFKYEQPRRWFWSSNHTMGPSFWSVDHQNSNLARLKLQHCHWAKDGIGDQSWLLRFCCSSSEGPKVWNALANEINFWIVITFWHDQHDCLHGPEIARFKFTS